MRKPGALLWVGQRIPLTANLIVPCRYPLQFYVRLGEMRLLGIMVIKLWCLGIYNKILCVRSTLERSSCVCCLRIGSGRVEIPELFSKFSKGGKLSVRWADHDRPGGESSVHLSLRLPLSFRKTKTLEVLSPGFCPLFSGNCSFTCWLLFFL